MLRVFNEFVAALRGKSGWLVFLGVWALLLLASFLVFDGRVYSVLSHAVEGVRTAVTFDGQLMTTLS